MFRVKLVLLFLFTASLFILSCDETTEPEEPDTNMPPLFTANFTNDWLCADCGEGVILLTSLGNTLIAEQPFTGNGQVVFEGSADYGELGERINVTLVYRTENGGIGITTDLNVKLESTWHLRGYPQQQPVHEGTKFFKLINKPENTGYLISSLNTSYRTEDSSLPDVIDFATFSDDNSFYLQVNTLDSAPQYIWIDKTAEDTIGVDLSELKPTVQKTIDRIEGFEFTNIRVYGFLSAGDHYSGAYFIDRQNFDDPSPINSIVVNYPDSGFAEYFSRLEFFDTDSRTDYYSQKAYGDIISVIDLLDVDFEFVNTAPDNFEIAITGTEGVQIGSHWRMSDAQDIEWNVYSGTDIYSYSLPDLNTDLINAYFPEIDRSNFNLISTGIIEHEGLTSHDAVLDVVFGEGLYFWNQVNSSQNRFRYYTPE